MNRNWIQQADHGVSSIFPPGHSMRVPPRSRSEHGRSGGLDVGPAATDNDAISAESHAARSSAESIPVIETAPFYCPSGVRKSDRPGQGSGPLAVGASVRVIATKGSGFAGKEKAVS